MTKGCALKQAAALGLVLIAPDTSPRGLNVPGEDTDWDFGTGAGFYVDATVDAYKGYQMYSYITKELPELISQHFPIDPLRTSIFGHSMVRHRTRILICRVDTVH